MDEPDIAANDRALTNDRAPPQDCSARVNNHIVLHIRVHNLITGIPIPDCQRIDSQKAYKAIDTAKHLL